MRNENVPAIGWRYWAAISAASVFGANMGDFVSHVLHLGHIRGLPFLALAFAALLFAERRSTIGNEAWYWTAIVLLRTAATNLADLATHDLKTPYAWVIAALEALLVLLAASSSRGGLPRSAGWAWGWYWAAMLTAGTLGTAAGDCTADEFGLGAGMASLLLVPMLGVVLAAASRSGWATAAAYWISIVAVRSAGTTVGDFLAGDDGLGLGLPLSTAVTGAVLVAILALWRPGAAPRWVRPRVAP